MKSNIDVIIVVLLGYLIYQNGEHIFELINIKIPSVLLVFIFYLLVTLMLKKLSFLFFISFSFLFLTGYFSVITYGKISFENVLLALDSNRFAIKGYALLLLPFLFIGFMLDFFNFSKWLSKIKYGKTIIIWIIPVLLKKEIIFSRFNILMDSFEARGIDSKHPLKKILLIHKWIIPLMITTIMEGVDSYQYNKMLMTNINCYEYKNSLNPSFHKTMLLIVLVFFLIFRLFLLW